VVATLFFVYARKDRRLRNDVEDHLALLKREGLISAWYDRMISPGEEWRDQIDRHLEDADVILLLVSASFLVSDYCYETEMARAMERHYGDEARVIPVIVRPCQWKSAPFGKLQALPADGKPVTLWSNRDAALLNIADGIRSAVEAIQGTQAEVSVAALDSAKGRADPVVDTESGEAGWFDVIAAAEVEGQGLLAVLGELTGLQEKVTAGTERRTKEIEELGRGGKLVGQAMLLIAAGQAREMNDFATRIDEILPKYKARWQAYRKHTLEAARRLGARFGPSRQDIVELIEMVGGTQRAVIEVVPSFRRLQQSYDGIRGIARVLNSAISRASAAAERLIAEFSATADDVGDLLIELSAILDAHPALPPQDEEPQAHET
jgi:hypothetical protein